MYLACSRAFFFSRVVCRRRRRRPAPPISYRARELSDGLMAGRGGVTGAAAAAAMGKKPPPPPPSPCPPGCLRPAGRPWSSQCPSGTSLYALTLLANYYRPASRSFPCVWYCCRAGTTRRERERARDRDFFGGPSTTARALRTEDVGNTIAEG